MKNRKILHKLLLYFGASLLLYSFVAGAIFIPLLRSQTIHDYKSYLGEQAASIASSVEGFLSGTTKSGGKNFSGTGSGGYGAYLRFVDNIAMADVWIVDENMNLITGNNNQQGIQYKDFPEDADQVVQKAFSGTTTFSEGFSNLLDAPTITVGTPIVSGNEILGVVLLHAPVSGIQDTTWQSIGLLSVSTGIALIIAAVLALYLAISFTKPLEKIKKSALKLAEGDYATRTGLQDSGEIGDLATALDVLGCKLEEAKEESAKLDKLREEFVANISHELNTPVTVIRGSLEALQDGIVTHPEQVQEYHSNMLKESISLQRLVRDLLELSRLQNADFSMDMQNLNLPDILRDVLRSAARLSEEKNIALQFENDVQFFPVKGDYGRLRQMFLIILDNAIKFSSHESTVEISISEGQVSIRDYGIGIPSKDLPHIFDRFYSTKSPENKEGSGLGLAIAKQIADRHGIVLTATSNVNQGTEFTFAFPRL